MKRALALVACTLLVAVMVPRCHRCRTIGALDLPRVPVRPYADRMPTGGERVAVIADTQRTSFQECLIGREVNDDAQRALMASLAREDVGAVVIAGDMVFQGSSETHWGYFDWLMEPLHRRGVSVLPALGNHEYYGSLADSRARIRERFPRLARRSWYSDQWGAVGMIWLDSNVDELAPERWQAQRSFFQRALSDFDADPRVRAVLVFMHHPPFTNSTLVAPDETLQREVVPAFCEARKTLAMFTGHAHGYERFVRGAALGCGARDRQFVVTGGGGGPRPSGLRSEAETRLHDACEDPAPRAFHYLLLSQDEVGVTITARGINTGETAVHALRSPVEMRFVTP